MQTGAKGLKFEQHQLLVAVNRRDQMSSVKKKYDTNENTGCNRKTHLLLVI